MLPKYHILYGFVFSSLIFWLFPEIGLLGFIIIFVASVLIDIDHYLFFIVTHKDLRLKNAYDWFIKKSRRAMKLNQKERLKLKAVPCILHGLESAIILTILSFYHTTFFYIFIGFIFHQFLDLVWAIYYGFSFKHMGSQTYNILKYKKIF